MAGGAGGGAGEGEGAPPCFNRLEKGKTALATAVLTEKNFEQQAVFC